MENPKIHYNIPQIMFKLLMAKTNYLEWGRGTGKSTGPIADFIIENVHAMPRSNGCFVGDSYEQILTSTLPAVVKGLEERGMYEGVHFMIGKPFDKRFNVEGALIRPKNFKHYIQFYNGTGIYMLSQDRNSVAGNGRSVEWAVCDEAKYLNFDQLEEELILAMRGNPHIFGDRWNYLSMLFTSDRPMPVKRKYLESSVINSMDHELFEFLLPMCVEVERLKHKLINCKTKSTANRHRQKITKLQYDINELKRGESYFSQATTFDNVHALGMDVIESMYKSLSDVKFKRSVLTEEVKGTEAGFYPHLNPNVHGYVSTPDYGYIDGLDLDFKKGADNKNCKWDTDVVPALPLHIAADSNAAINCVTTAQVLYGQELKMISAFFVLDEERLEDQAQKWCDYYAPHPEKVVYFYFDHTFVWESGREKKGISHASKWQDILKKNKWTVLPKYLGQTESYVERYSIWSNIFKGDDEVIKRFSYNLSNASQWENSVTNAEYKNTERSFVKDKRWEKDKNFPQEEATHLSDAGDTLMVGVRKLLMSNQEEFVDSSTV